MTTSATVPDLAPPDLPLPRRPRLLPGLEVVDRRADELQIGLDPARAVVVTGLAPVLVDILRTLDGRRGLSTLFTQATEAHAGRLHAVLADLLRRGLVEDAAPTGPRGRQFGPGPPAAGVPRGRADTPPRRAYGTVRVQGDGRLAAAITESLATAGVEHLDVRAAGVVDDLDVGAGFLDRDVGRSRTCALREVARRAHTGVRTGPLRHGRVPDLVLLTDAVVPAPDVVAPLMAAGAPHLPVRVREGIGIVGPLVVPGRTSCLRCADLHRVDLDPCWPTVAGQLAGRRQHTDLASAHGTAAIAVGQALRALAPSPEHPPPTWEATLELDCYAGIVRRRDWPPHPHCACGAPARPSRRGPLRQCR